MLNLRLTLHLLGQLQLDASNPFISSVEAKSTLLGSFFRAAATLPFLVLLFPVLVGSWVLNSSSNGFCLGYHIDEPKKVEFVRFGKQDFRQPVLLLEIGRLANSFTQADTPQQVVQLCRSCSALIGVGLVLAVACIVREFAASGFAVLSAMMTAAFPLVALHSHYFKEDILLSLCLLLSMGAIARYLRNPTLNRTLVCGLSTGLAAAAHYKGVLALALFILLPCFFSLTISRKRICINACVCVLTAIAMFACINVAMFDNAQTFVEGVHFQSRHVIDGHSIRILPVDFGFCFHLSRSLVPGIGAVAVAVAALGIFLVLRNWRSSPAEVRLALTFFALFYLAIELSPLKPSPNYERYAVPLGPMAAIIIAHFMNHYWKMSSGLVAHGSLAALGLLLVLPPLYDSVRIIAKLEHDTREVANNWISATNESAVFESHCGRPGDTTYAADIDLDALRRRQVRYLVTSSFAYDRFYLGSKLRSTQRRDVYVKKSRYDMLFNQYEFIEFAPAYRTYAFSNPVIRVIDLCRPKVESNDAQ